MTYLNSTEFNDLEFSDWGLFIILDEEENKEMSYRKMRKNIIQIETIEEGECEYETGDIYGEKFEYYKTDMERDANMTTDREFVKDYDNDEDHDNDHEKDKDDATNDMIKKKFQFLITYALTTSFSIALIILTFSI